MTERAPTFAVVFKSHRWDPFVARQLARYREAAEGAPVFLVLDETGRDFSAVQDEHLVRTTNADLVRMGLADRSERGNLLWWNTDYQNYYLQDLEPGYDYYLCVEYDTRILGSIKAFVDQAALREADMVSLPIRQPKAEWMWTRFHARTYGYDDVKGSLNCIALFSARALTLLKARRIAMSQEHLAGRIPFWPGNEVFSATEVGKAGYRFLSLSEFGDVDGYEWFPPILEDDVVQTPTTTFLHPVLDKTHYIQSLLRFENSLTAYFRKNSSLRRTLRRFPAADYEPALPAAAFLRAKMRLRERLQGLHARWQNRREGLVSQSGTGERTAP